MSEQPPGGAGTPVDDELPEQLRVRRAKLDRMREAGVDPYPVAVARTTTLAEVREAHPDAYIVGEVLHGDYTAIVAESGMDAVTQYELWQASWHSIADLNFFELDWTLTRHNEFLDAFVPYTFAGNHDVSRFATRIPD